VQGFGGDHLAHTALEREPTVTAAAPRRGAGALGAEILKPATAIMQLAVEKPAAVAEKGVVGAELVAVVAKGDGVPVISPDSRRGARVWAGAEEAAIERDRHPLIGVLESLSEDQRRFTSPQDLPLHWRFRMPSSKAEVHPSWRLDPHGTGWPAR
jgi:hypothetical protein